jgi:hypothetical protein
LEKITTQISAKISIFIFQKASGFFKKKLFFLNFFLLFMPQRTVLDSSESDPATSPHYEGAYSEPWNFIVPGSAADLPRIRRGFAADPPRICRGSAADPPRICRGSAADLPRICRGSAADLPKSIRFLLPKNSKGTLFKKKSKFTPQNHQFFGKFIEFLTLLGHFLRKFFLPRLQILRKFFYRDFRTRLHKVDNVFKSFDCFDFREVSYSIIVS